MDWSGATWWWIACGVLVALEMTTGTFYLLMLAAGALAGAVSAHAGLRTEWQLLVAALCGMAAVGTWHWRRRPASAAPSLQLDIGASVQVDAWQDHAARVNHRGTQWDARYVGQGSPLPGRYVITAVDGSRLLLDH